MHHPTSWAEDWGAISRKEMLHDTELVSTDDLYETTQTSCSIDWRSHLWHNVTEKSKIALASYARPSLPKLSPCYCALHFPIAPCHGEHHEKVGGHSKKLFSGICAPTFEMLPAPLVRLTSKRMFLLDSPPVLVLVSAIILFAKYCYWYWQ